MAVSLELLDEARKLIVALREHVARCEKIHEKLVHRGNKKLAAHLAAAGRRMLFEAEQSLGKLEGVS